LLPETYKTWEEALDYCKCLNSNNYLGYSDWRLPNRVELQSLIDYQRDNPSLPQGHPFGDVNCGEGPHGASFWTSTTVPSSEDKAWYVSISHGVVTTWDSTKKSYMGVWPFRYPNNPPTADAGPDQTVDEGVTVTLDGSNSTDPDDGIASYQWAQIGGISVTISDPTTSQPTFTAPDVGPNGEALTFQLTVTDYGDLQTSEEVIVSINDSGDGGGDDGGGGTSGVGGCFITTLLNIIE